MREQDDTALVQQTLAGNLKAFEVLVERYQKTIFNLALRMVHDADDAEDVAQVVLVKAYEHLPSYNPTYKFFSWLYRIAMNESLNFLRQKRPFERMEDVGEASGIESSLDSLDIARLVGDAMTFLTHDQRAVITLRHTEGLSYLEIAQILRISEKKVKSRLFSARQILRDLLVKRGVGRQ